MAAISMGVVAILVAVVFLGGYAYAHQTAHIAAPRPSAVAFVMVLWMLATGALAISGALSNFEARPPPLALLMAVVVLGGTALGFSPVGEVLARALPLWMLVLGQAFRLPLELTLHLGHSEGLVPVQMTYAGWNFDILTGVSAIPVSIALRRWPSRAFAVLWSALGFVLMLTIGGIAAASTPMIRAFGDDPARLNTFTAQFPFVWIGTCVMVAIIWHVAIFRTLRMRRGLAHTPVRPA